MDRRMKTTSSRVVPSSPLEGGDFAPFGEVVQNPALHSESNYRLSSVKANQGTATKWLNISRMDNHYGLAPSKKPARAVMNMFVCEPRTLLRKGNKQLFPVRILERHPFTPQTFIPLGVSPHDEDARYLVIVAPTLPSTARDGSEAAIPPYPTPERRRKKSFTERLLGGRPNPFTNDFSPTTTPPILDAKGRKIQIKGPGEPDLTRLRAFVARGDQAVIYGPGTWHAPMVVLGDKPIDFVVVQHANDVPLEDCQEIDIVSDDGSEGLTVDVDGGADIAASGAGIMRAKL